MNTLFISDLHLSETAPEATALFFQFIKTTTENAKALYILGDFFEAWIGDDEQNAFIDRIKAALRDLTDNGLPIYLMHGNRDFLIRKRFAKETGVTLLKEPTRIELNGRPILLLHGDSLCTLDVQHQKSRKIMHNRFYQTLALLLPLKIRQRYGNRFRSASAERKSHLADAIMDVSPDEVIRVMSDAKVNLLIHGHTHRPAQHDLTIHDAKAQRIVLGAWLDKASYLSVDDNNVFELKTIHLPKN